MNVSLFLFSFLCLLLGLFSQRVSSQDRASTPPRGWNSYDSFIWTISEEEFSTNAEIMAKQLLPHGYEYAVVDYLWYRRKVPGAYVDSLGFDVIDEWGRPIPDPVRWPSSRGGKGFTKVAAKVHSLGLKFGIHVMRGISTQAVNANTFILDTNTGTAYKEAGRKWTAKDIGIKERTCAWMHNGFMSVNTELGAGKAFLRSLYKQYAEWGVDFVKNDCVFGEDLDVPEITYISEILKQLERPILYSLSPGTRVTPDMAKAISGMVNMYRITGDDWDSWGDVLAHFDITRDFAAADMIGAKGLLGKSWPDLDMLPLGWLSDPGSNHGPHRWTNLGSGEQRTQMTLWSIARSPLMFGGDLRKLPDELMRIITNDVVLEIDSFSSNNREFSYITSNVNARAVKNDDKFHTWQSRRHLTNAKTANTHAFGLTTCADAKAIGWSTQSLDQDLEHICWTENSRRKHQAPFCLNKRDSLLAIDEDITDKHQYQGKVNLLASDGTDRCLHASPKRRVTSKDVKRGFFSPCRWDANQMWELNPNGTLVNSYSGLCARIDPFEGNKLKPKAINNVARSWIATGRKGEIYVAFFNLLGKLATITAERADLARELPMTKLVRGSCEGSEVWTGRYLGVIGNSISFSVIPHGVALIVLHCS
ncbi:probable alpha-galactosidase D isoform X1 [Pyrus communis]|uniref:probable alpha-galactosidase D isoform X1 n=1 Tax=Pyrus communis TaxID=23211 RepID=UPI0035C03535